MFGISTHNQQFLFHLSQISPRRNNIALKHNNKKKNVNLKNNEVVLSQNNVEDLCHVSFNEALKNLKSSRQSIYLNTASNVPLHKRIRNDLLKDDQLWKMSYVSSSSFAKNRGEPIFCNNIALKSTSTFLNNLCESTKLGSVIQIRGFKTQRTIEAQLKRNPPIASRLRDFFVAGSSGTIKSLDQLMVSGNFTEHNEKLSKLLQTDASVLKNDDKKRIIVAFAEGYLAGNTSGSSNKRSKFTKYLKAFQNVFIVAIILAFLVKAKAPGSFFRIQLGPNMEINPEDVTITFNDVKGSDEAKQELQELVEFLKNPDKFSTLGGKLPKGVLLVGPPGTGKTLLARAVAGEAGVPFFHVAGAEFDEVFVGQGARRVRDLFKVAKIRAPCVIFIDEIDSVGGKRTTSLLHPYANQTINQLLSEMDGFHENEGVIVLGATNRREDLDIALLRPGRFDVEVKVQPPDLQGRKDILSLYLKKVLHKDIDVQLLARGTVGFTGADLESMVNQAALRAAIDGDKFVSMKHLLYSKDKLIMGPERKSRVPDEAANLITAYHEGGHALVAYYTNTSYPLHKVTIMPRGESLGHTAYLPEKDEYYRSKQQLLASMDSMLGGRAAEELIFGADKITAGAASDLKQATSLAQQMVKEWGMSEKVGLRTFERPNAYSNGEVYSPNTNELVDSEIKKILADSYERAKNILKTHAKEHKALAEALLKYETLDADDVKAILSGEKLPTDAAN